MRSIPGEYHGFFWFFFINEQLLRFLDLRYPRDYNTVPRLYFWLLNLAWIFPWSVYLPAATRLSYRADRSCRKDQAPGALLDRVRSGLLYLFHDAGVLLHAVLSGLRATDRFGDSGERSNGPGGDARADRYMRAVPRSRPLPFWWLSGMCRRPAIFPRR